MVIPGGVHVDRSPTHADVKHASQARPAALRRPASEIRTHHGEVGQVDEARAVERIGEACQQHLQMAAAIGMG